MKRVVLLAISLLLCLPSSASADNAKPSEKITLYVFFATWCTPCRVELPHVQRFYELYGARGLEVVLVSEDAPSTAQNIPAFLARFGVTAKWILDDESQMLERFNPTANVPFTVLVNDRGKVLYAHPGFEPGDEKLLEARIVELLPPRGAAFGGPSNTTAVPTTTPDATSPESTPDPTPNPTSDVARRANKGTPVTVSASSLVLGVHRTSKFDTVAANNGTLQAAVGRIEVRGHTDKYSASVRVDGAVVDDTVAGEVDRDLRLERIQLSGTLGPVQLTAGDDYVSFGHGVALSLRRVDPLGLDTSLRGGRVDVDYRSFEITGIAGITNPQNLDPIGLQIVDAGDGGVGPGRGALCGEGRECDFIGGVEITTHPTKRLEVSPYFLYAHAPMAASDGGDITWTLGGVSTAGSIAGLSFAAETAAGRREGANLEIETPIAAYLSVQKSWTKWTVIAQSKFYRDWEMGRSDRGLLYHEPPTLEREDQEVPSNDNVLGSQLRAEYRPSNAAATIFASALYYRYTQDGTGATSSGASNAAHGFIGLEKRFGTSVSGAVSIGYRREAESDGTRKVSLYQVDLDVAARLPAAIRGRPLAVTFKWNHREETKRVFNDLQFRRGLAIAGLSLSGIGVVSALYGYSTERNDGIAPTHYPGGELLVHLPRGGNVRVFAGRLSGGRVCVSGSCRDVPPFEGARVDLMLRY